MEGKRDEGKGRGRQEEGGKKVRGREEGRKGREEKEKGKETRQGGKEKGENEGKREV